MGTVLVARYLGFAFSFKDILSDSSGREIAPTALEVHLSASNIHRVCLLLARRFCDTSSFEISCKDTFVDGLFSGSI